MSSYISRTYEGMLPPEEIPGHRGYYPASNFGEWEQLPDLYKAMEWAPAPDHHNKGELRAVKAIIFDVVHMEPYKISGEMSVHPQEIQKILFCLYDNPQCHLYSISAVELDGGTRLAAHWLQDSISGAFGVYAGGCCVGRQGGFQGFVPACIERTEDGQLSYNCQYDHTKRVFMEHSNPFPMPVAEKDKSSLDMQIAEAGKVGRSIESAGSGLPQPNLENR